MKLNEVKRKPYEVPNPFTPEILQWLYINWDVVLEKKNRNDKQWVLTEGHTEMILFEESTSSEIWIEDGKLSLKTPRARTDDWKQEHHYSCGSNPPIEMGEIIGAMMRFSHDWDDLRTLPSKSNNRLHFASERLKSLKGISRYLREADSIQFTVERVLTGVTELAMIKVGDLSAGSLSSTDIADCRQAIRKVAEHIKKHGHTQILELRKQLIADGYGAYA